LQIDFQKADFDRRSSEPNHDPSIQFAFAIANKFLAKIREVGGGIAIKPVRFDSAFWRIDYLTDDGEELAHNPDLFRRRVSTSISGRLAGVNEGVWSKVTTLPADFEPHTWNVLLLDAESLLPEVGASIVLAYSALETFISWSLDQLAPLSSIPPELWTWINDRDDWYKEPSVAEQYDQLLRIITGKSLKDELLLWEALQNLRRARNSFTHTGKPIIGGKEVTAAQAIQLIGQTKAIIDWVEKLLPEVLRRPRFLTIIDWHIQKTIIAPTSHEASP